MRLFGASSHAFDVLLSDYLVLSPAGIEAHQSKAQQLKRLLDLQSRLFRPRRGDHSPDHPIDEGFLCDGLVDVYLVFVEYGLTLYEE